MIDATDAVAAGIDLRPFVNLCMVKLALSQSFGVNAHCPDMLRSFLHSWAALLPSRTLVLEPMRHDDQYPYPTRDAYVSMLKDVGRVSEEVLFSTSHSRDNDEGRVPGESETRVVIDVDDIEPYRGWWLEQAVSCFPSFRARDGLGLNMLGTSKCSYGFLCGNPASSVSTFHVCAFTLVHQTDYAW